MATNIKKLQPNPDNPRTISKERFEKLKASIERNPDGLSVHKISHKDGIILSGNQRYRALQELGIDLKPEWFKDLTGWTAEQIEEWTIQSNVAAGEWDWDALANEWPEHKLEEWGVDIPLEVEPAEGTNKEIDVENLREGMNHECPRCKFQF